LNWSIILFCYNEAGTLAETAYKCFDFLSKNAAQYEIIIVNDGSTDSTSEICEKLKQEIPQIRIIEHKINLGIGGALKTGYVQARYEYVCAVPSDGQFNPDELQAVKEFNSGYFFSFYRENHEYSRYRKNLSLLNKLFNRFLLGIKLRDVNWIKVYRNDQLRKVNPQLNSSIIESEICAKLIKSGVKPIETLSVYHPRKSGMSKGGSWVTIAKAMKETWSLYRIVRVFQA